MGTLNQRLRTQSVSKSFFQYFLPTLFGMMLMSVNIVIDGIFVGNGVGSVALASVNIAVPVFSIIISLALLIGMGGGTLYSMAMGQKNQLQARKIFTLSMVLITVLTIVISAVSYVNMEKLALLFGANQDTLPYVLDYMRISFISSLILSLETRLSIFVRNDGDPQLAMMGLVASSILNIGLNYIMIFVLGLEVKGAAIATVLATLIGLLIYMLHFFKKGSNLKLTKISLEWQDVKSIGVIGFPSFFSEAGMAVFVIGYNITVAYYLGTVGLAAFSVINYLHTFMFLAFIGIGSTIQPLVSFYYGAQKDESIKKTIQLAERTGLCLGILFLAIGFFGADQLVAIFGVETAEISEVAAKGLKLFFLGYLFMGINFTYMTYYQSIGQVRPSIMITIFRGFILLILMLFVLPMLIGDAGIWLALPAAEAIVAIFILIFARKGVMERTFFLGEKTSQNEE